MRYSDTVIEQARALRAAGASYPEISQQLGRSIPKTTLAYWCRKIPLSPDQIQGNIERQLTHLAHARKLSVLQKHHAATEQLRVISLRSRAVVQRAKSSEVHLIALAMLYLGEGAKPGSHSGLALGSSDPNIIRLYITLLSICFSIGPDDLRCRVSFRADQDIAELQQYWSSVTGIPLNHFYKTSPDQRTIGKLTKRTDYRGVCVISCRGRVHQLELQQISREYLKSITGR